MRAVLKKTIDKSVAFIKYKKNGENIEELEDYIYYHGTCENGILEYARFYRQNGNFNEARNYLEILLGTKNEPYALTEFVLLELANKDYAACLKYLEKLKVEDPDLYLESRYFTIEVYCYARLGLKLKINPNFLRYTEKLIYNYSEADAIKHIELHNSKVYMEYMNIDDIDFTNNPENFFNEEIDVANLFDDVRKVLSMDKVSSNYNGIFANYLFYYRNIGDNSKGQLNYLKVVTIAGTNDIITMFPYGFIDKEYLKIGNQVYDFLNLLNEVKEQKVLCRQ